MKQIGTVAAMAAMAAMTALLHVFLPWLRGELVSAGLV